MAKMTGNNGEIVVNYTRYDTEDLQRVVDAALAVTLQHVSLKTPLKVEYQEKKQRQLEKDRPGSRLVVMGDCVLKIAPPDRVWEDYPLHGLGSVVPVDHPMLPDEVVVLIGKVLLYRASGHWSYARATESPVFSAFVARVRKLQVRIHPRSVDKKPPSIKRTADEKLQRLIELHGEGGTLPRIPGRRTQSWDPEWMDTCRSIYEKELARRGAIRAKIIAAKGFVPPYETFPDLLRRVAREIDYSDDEETTP